MSYYYNISRFAQMFSNEFQCRKSAAVLPREIDYRISQIAIVHIVLNYMNNFIFSSIRGLKKFKELKEIFIKFIEASNGEVIQLRLQGLWLWFFSDFDYFAIIAIDRCHSEPI